jgi:hypothetical protein
MKDIFKWLLIGGAAYFGYEWITGGTAVAATPTPTPAPPAAGGGSGPAPAATPDPAAVAAKAAINAKAAAQLAALNSPSAPAALISQAEQWEAQAASLQTAASALPAPNNVGLIGQANLLLAQATSNRAQAAAIPAPSGGLSADDVTKYASAGYQDVVALSDALGVTHTADEWN